ncbi:hypothetical protein OCL97_04985 [Phenylobacterium sp. HK31G]|uniref:Uncharacterized protein n=1 Tax=Phenylobacterium ferrooxidans TaxID=2982689 RepID=A0ABW6CSZ6_9CAUL
MSLDVFEEDDVGVDLLDDAGDLRPQVAGVGCPPADAAEGERLAGIARKQAMNPAAPRAAVEGSKVIPDSRLRQRSVSHARRERGRGVAVALDEADGSETGLGQVDAEVEAAIAGAEGKSKQVGGR